MRLCAEEREGGERERAREGRGVVVMTIIVTNNNKTIIMIVLTPEISKTPTQ